MEGTESESSKAKPNMSMMTRESDMKAVSEQRSWWHRVDWLVYILGIVAVIVYVLHGFDGYLNRDRAIYSYAGQQVAEGVPPYLGILNRAGPLAHVIPGIGVIATRRWVRRSSRYQAGVHDLRGCKRVRGLPARARFVYLASGRTRRRHGPPELPRVHRIRNTRAPGEDADGVLPALYILGASEAAVAHRGDLREPRSAHLAAVLLGGAGRSRFLVIRLAFRRAADGPWPVSS